MSVGGCAQLITAMLPAKYVRERDLIVQIEPNRFLMEFGYKYLSILLSPATLIPAMAVSLDSQRLKVAGVVTFYMSSALIVSLRSILLAMYSLNAL